jgi:hypothetical protein
VRIEGKSIHQLWIDSIEDPLETLGALLQRGILVLDHQGIERRAVIGLHMGATRYWLSIENPDKYDSH